MSKAENDFFARLQKTDSVKQTVKSEGSAVEKELAKKDADFSTPLTIRNLFTHHEAHPVVLDLSLQRVFGQEWFHWEAATVWDEIQRVFQSQISEHARTKIQALRTLHVVDLPWTSWPVFEKVMQALNGNLPDWGHMQAVSLEHLYAGVDMLEHIRKREFSEEVRLYMAGCVLHEDVFFVPPPLDFIQAEVAQPYYVCLDCRNQNSALFHDGTCDVCAGKYANGTILGEAENEKAGKNVEIHLRFDPDPVEARWKQVADRESKDVKLEETPVDVQVDRLLVARDYMNVRRRQLIEQITSLKSWLGTGR